MKRVILQTLMFTGLVLLISCENKITCQREFTMRNSTSDMVIMAALVKNGEDNCMLTFLHEIQPNDQVTHEYRTCLQDKFSNKPLEFYIVDPNKFNILNEFYDCESIDNRNTILKKYSLSTDELKSMNWTIPYP